MQIQQYTSTYPLENGEAFVRYQSVLFVDMGEYFYQTQEYVAQCHRDADENEGQPLRTFDILIDEVGLMEPVIAYGEMIDLHVTPEWVMQGGGDG